MKKRILRNCSIILVLILVLCAGCGGANTTDKAAVTPSASNDTTPTSDITASGDAENGTDTNVTDEEGYYFVTDDLEIRMNEEMAPIKEKLGEPNFYFEATSCAFEGLDKTYTYDGFEIYTYTSNDIEYVFSVYFISDSPLTKEGAGIGMALDELLALYGEGYEQNFDQYTYKKGNCKLSFLIEEDKVTSVEYYLLSDE